MLVRLLALVVAMLICWPFSIKAADEFTLSHWHTTRLSDVFFSEGAGVGDFNKDGKTDIMAGPFWYEGPEFKKSHAYYPPKPFDPKGYSDNFFAYSQDFSGDGWDDILIIGFPGVDASWFENPAGKEGMWVRHKILEPVDNESPTYVDITGDGQREIVCSSNGYFGFAGPDPKDARQPWKFRRISPEGAGGKFTHGLGVGDVNGDGKPDLLEKNGWWEQPAAIDGDPVWKKHAFQFAGPGGAQMYAYDFDGDGDNDVLTSLAAHGHGLTWYENRRNDPTVDTKDGEIAFKKHDIMGATPDKNRYGLVFSQLHAIDLADIDGDGIKDIVTGKRYWAHGPNGDPDPGAPPVIYWFRTTRLKDKTVDFVPHLIHDDSGVGVEVKIVDVSNDGVPDVVVGNKKGAFFHIQHRMKVTKAEWEAAQPMPRDHAAKAAGNGLPPNEGLLPQEAAKAMTVPEGFKVQLAAGEPLVHQPVAFAFDERGRIWFAEAHTYPERAPEGEGKDKIVILEDKDLDGTFETRKVFVEGLNLVSGLEVGFGGVWVGAAPYLMFIPDRNKDDIPDGVPMKAEPTPGLQFPKDVPPGATVLLDGLGWQDTHETINGFIWGPDGWLYGCHGVFTHSKVGKPGTADKDRVPMNAAVWRYHPIRHQFEIFAHGASNQWGVDFNEHGQAFITACVIPHLYHVIQGGRYQRQAGQHFNPYTFDDIKTIADHAHYAGNLADHAWWGRNEAVAHNDTHSAGGGHAHAGAMIYLGDNWPARYRNTLFMANIHGNRVNNDVLKPRGSGYVGSHGNDLLFANDRWFRAINLKTGPDGAVYVIDWYDKNACHRRQPEIWDRTNGRIYRVTYGDRKPERVDLSKLNNDELAALHSHRNEWQVRMARKVLQERSATPSSGVAGVPLNERLETLAQSTDVAQQLRALWTLHAVGALKPEHLAKLLSATGPNSEHLRVWALKLDAEDRQLSAAVAAGAEVLAAKDSSPIVRLAIASALQRTNSANKAKIAASLLAHAEDADDHNLPIMYWYAVEPLVGADPTGAMQLARASKIPLVTKFIYRRAASEDGSLGALLAELGTVKDEATQRLMLDEIVAVVKNRGQLAMPEGWPGIYEKLAKHEAADVRQKAQFITVKFGDKSIFPALRGIVGDSKADVDSRLQALDALVTGKDTELPKLLQGLLADAAVRRPVLRALAQVQDAATAPAILASYKAFNDDEKQDAITTLAARPQTALALLESIESKKIPRTDLSAFTVGQMLRLKNDDLTKRLTEVWGAIRSTADDKQKLITEFKPKFRASLLGAADLSNGRAVYTKTCAKCHKLFGDGGKIGPEITGSNRANIDYILENILDPSAVIGRDYQMTLLELKDGRVISGLIKEENDSALVVQTVNEVVTVPKSDIETRAVQPISMMPEGQLQQLKPDDQRDLIAYLASPSQVPMPGEGPVMNSKTKRISGALEGESLKILSKTGGAAGAQGMGGFTNARNQWSGEQLWWTGGKPGDKLVFELPVKDDGDYEVFIGVTKARDYGIVQLSIDDKSAGAPFDGFNVPEVIHSGPITLGTHSLKAGYHKLTVEVKGTNPKAVPAHMFGLDYVYLAKKAAEVNSK